MERAQPPNPDGGAGVPAGAVRTTTEILADPDLRDRGMFVDVEHPEYGELAVPGWPAQMSRSPARVTAPPTPGADTQDVLAEWLGAPAGTRADTAGGAS